MMRVAKISESSFTITKIKDPSTLTGGRFQFWKPIYSKLIHILTIVKKVTDFLEDFRIIVIKTNIFRSNFKESLKYHSVYLLKTEHPVYY